MKFLNLSILILLLLPGISSAAGGGGGNSKYLALEPPFVVNLQDDKRIRFLQIKSQLKLAEVELAPEVNHHMAKIRHVLLMLFSHLSEEEIRTLEGKENLREESLIEIQAALEEETGDSMVEQIYFTDFVIQ